MSGYCSCPVGLTCAPCKHKAAVVKYTGKAQFSGTPKNDPCQRALYHYIAWGRTLEPHMYRNTNDSSQEHNIAQYISEMLERSKTRLHESLYEDDPAIIAALEVEECDEEEVPEFNNELIREKFANAMDAYKEKILNLHVTNAQDPSMNKAMMAFTKTIQKSLNCTPTTLQKQMHEFGKGTVATNRTKNGRIINVNPPAVSRRTFKVPGRGPAPLGRPLKEKGAKTQMIVTNEDDFIAMSDKSVKTVVKKQHNLAKTVKNNETLPRRHTKQGN